MFMDNIWAIVLAILLILSAALPFCFKNVRTIAFRELKLYFISPVAYVVAVLVLGWVGFYFVFGVVRAILASVYYASPAPGVDDIVLGPMVFIVLFAVPAVTMRLLADEQRTGTLELLLTAPVRDWELVVGKWLGGVLFMLSILAITLIYPFVLNRLVENGIDQGPLVTGYLGLILLIASLVSIGVAISSLFANQVAAFFVTLFIVLMFAIIQPLNTNSAGTVVDIFNYLNFLDHYYQNFFVGIIELRDVVYYLSLTALGLFFGSVSIETRRWR
jgi:ABC-2 type transport system permease protein